MGLWIICKTFLLFFLHFSFQCKSETYQLTDGEGQATAPFPKGSYLTLLSTLNCSEAC